MYLNLRTGVLLFECKVCRPTFKTIARPTISRRGGKAQNLTENVPGPKTYISFFSLILL
jgi:hypothetical protein